MNIKWGVVSVLMFAASVGWAGNVEHTGGTVAPAAGGMLPVDQAMLFNLGESIDTKLAMLVELESGRAKDSTQFCYLDDRAYSEGAVHDESVCERSTMFSEGKRSTTLEWVAMPIHGGGAPAVVTPAQIQRKRKGAQ